MQQYYVSKIVFGREPLVSCNYIAGLTVSKIKYGWCFI